MNRSRTDCHQHLNTLIQLIHNGCDTVFVGVKPLGRKDNLLICLRPDTFTSSVSIPVINNGPKTTNSVFFQITIRFAQASGFNENKLCFQTVISAT